MNMRSFVPSAGLALAAMLLTACGSTPDDGAGTTRLSIASLMGQDTEFTQEDWSKQETRVQELTAQCMTEQGWEYIPVEYPDNLIEYSAADDLERRQREGFGIAYWTLNQGNDAAAIDDPMADWVDPNQAIVEAMSEDEMTAYYESLMGTQEEIEATQTIEIDPETGDEYYTSTGYGAGCQGEAAEAIYGSDPTQSEDYWTAVNRFYEELNTRVQADPRVKALDAEWSACMKAAGLDYDTRNAMYDTVYTGFQARHDEIVGDLFNRDPFEGMSEAEIQDFFETSTQEEINARLNVSFQLSDEQRAALEELLAEEIDIAVAEFECSTPYDKSYQDIYAQIEEQYATEHRTELEELAASLGVTP